MELALEVSVPGCHSDTTTMLVTPSTKMRDMITTALTKFKSEGQQLWVGTGTAAVKAVSCVEVIKRRTANLHQITQLVYKRVEEYWEPKWDGLDRLKVTREVPTIVILLSKTPLDSSLPGYQAPGTLTGDFCRVDAQQRRRYKPPRGRHVEGVVHSGQYKNRNITSQLNEGGERQEEGPRGTPKVQERGRGGGEGHKNTKGVQTVV